MPPSRLCRAQGYLKDEGPDHWKGSLYVFDGRMAIPGDLKGEPLTRNPENYPFQREVPLCFFIRVMLS